MILTSKQKLNLGWKASLSAHTFNRKEPVMKQAMTSDERCSTGPFGRPQVSGFNRTRHISPSHLDGLCVVYLATGRDIGLSAIHIMLVRRKTASSRVARQYGHSCDPYRRCSACYIRYFDNKFYLGMIAVFIFATSSGSRVRELTWIVSVMTLWSIVRDYA